MPHAATGREPAEAWSPVIDRVTGVEAALREHGEDLSVVLVLVLVGPVLGMRGPSRGDRVPSGSGAEDRAEALRRPRWADRQGPQDHLLVAAARMVLVFLLAPWALPRADGTGTVRNVLLSPGHGEGLLTESVRRDLGEAKEIVGRIAAAPIDAGFQQRTADVKRVIERIPAPGTALFDTPCHTPAATAAPPAGQMQAQTRTQPRPVADRPSTPWTTPRPRCSTPYAAWWPSPVRAARRPSPASCSGCSPPCGPGPATTRTRSCDGTRGQRRCRAGPPTAERPAAT
ncbi:hypothetical protein [Streptomyces sp. NPDC052721]|uniref:hypothetical protein n=1 Tax=Streptomyces sp. NPDC052721 TaxID=3154955 RepID=UPI0034441051